MKKDEQISNALGIASSPSTTEVAIITPMEALPVKTAEEEALAADARDDYTKSREVLRNLIDKGSETADSAMEVAQGTQAARNYEAAARLIEAVAGLTTQLLDLQEKTRRVRTYDDPTPVDTVTLDTKAFEGTMAELLELAEKTTKERKKQNSPK